MRIDPVVKKETLYILGTSILFSVVMELVFWLTGHMDYTVPLGNLLGVGISVLNYFLMGLTVQKSIGLDKKNATDKANLSLSLRMLMVFALAAVGVCLPCFHSWAVIIPLIFPFIAINLRPLVDKSMREQPQEEHTQD